MQKEYSISLLRMIAMIMVVFCHILEMISTSEKGFCSDYSLLFLITGNFLANGVQIFFMVSGYLYGGIAKEGMFSTPNMRVLFYFSSFKKILIKYWIYCIIIIIPVYYFLADNIITFGSILGLLTTADTIYGVHHLWFIPYILFCYIITPILYDFKKCLRKTESVYSYIFSILIIVLISYEFDSYFKAEWICCYFIGFYFRDIKGIIIKQKKCKEWIIYISILTIALNIFRLFSKYFYIGQIEGVLYLDLNKALCYWAQVFFAICVFVLVQRIKLNKPKTIRILDFSDKYSYDIYLVHMIFVKGILSTIFLTDYMMINIIITIIIVLISGILFHKVTFILIQFYENGIKKIKENCE